jgi:anti-anti-sigma regulatory factor
MSNNPVAACSRHDTVHIRIDGRAVAHDCPALRRYVESAVKDGCRRVRVHLQRCEHFDSTFLGTLLCLQRLTAENDPVELELVGTSDAAHAILKRMGAAALFRTDVGKCPEQGPWTSCEPEQAGNCSPEFKQNVVQAHRELAGVEGPLGATYRQIAEMAARDLEAAQNR